MAEETVSQLCSLEKENYADCTVGLGGHSTKILESGGGQSKLWGMDRDSEVLKEAEGNLERFGSRVKLRHGVFEELANWIEAGTIDGMIMDLGVSSVQIDRAERGFSFMKDGPLDMRMDNKQEKTAEMVVNDLGEIELAGLFYKYGEERNSRVIAKGIVRERLNGRIKTTSQLASCISKSVRGGYHVIHPATRVFQAIRIEVNDEIGILERALPKLLSLLKVGGRIAVISFHSIEDRVIKQFGEEVTRSYIRGGVTDDPLLRVERKPLFKWVVKRPITPSLGEIEMNPRSRSAKMRVIERIADN